MPTPIQLPFPKRGVNRTGNRSDQPPDTCWNALNVLPRDRQGRRRLAQRAGTSAILTPSTKVVNGLYQMVLAQASANDPFAFDDGFAYSNGSLTGQGNWAAHGADPAWTVVAASTEIIPTTGVGKTSYNQDTTSFTEWDTTALPWTVTIKFYVDSTINPAPQPHFFQLYWGDSTFSEFFLDATETSAGVMDLSLNSPATSNVYNDAAVTRNVEHTLTITAEYEAASAANVLTMSMDGVGFSPPILLGTATGLNPYMLLVGAGVRIREVSVNNAPTVTRDVRLIATSHGQVYSGTISGLTVVGGGPYLSNSKPGMADVNGHLYIVDGTNTKDFNVSANTIASLTASHGSVPTNCRVARTWRGRLVLANPHSAPQNFFMSRSGDPTDWDYAQTDPAAAFAGNASTAGRMDDIIVDMIPFNDDQMLIAGDHSLWLIEGDPADGGTIKPVSRSIGIVGRDAWTLSPDGTLYFIGTGGFYRMSPGGIPEALSVTSYNQFFTDLNRKTQYYSVIWDRDRHGAYIFITSIASSASTHLYYDAVDDGFWPLNFPDNHGPVSTLLYDGDSATDRKLLFGGRDGNIRKTDESSRTDDSAAMDVTVTLGPFQPGSPTGDCTIAGLDMTFGEIATGDDPSVWNVWWKLKGGKSAYDVTEGTPKRIAGGELPYAGKQLTRVTRVRGGWFALEFFNKRTANYFTLERVVVHAEQTGKQR